MKYFVISLFLLLTACESDINNGRICGVSNPTSNLPWLRSIIAKADSDKITKIYRGNYIGTIYLEKFDSQDVFYSTMTMYSGGMFFHAFHCNGQPVVFSSSQVTLDFLKNLKKNKLIYSNEP